MAELFGFKFERIKDSASKEKFTEPSSEDGTLEAVAGGFYGQLLDQDGRERTEQDLIRRYRDIAQQPECDSAIEDIINEGIVANEKDQAVAIELERLMMPKKIKDRIKEEFDTVLELLNFEQKGHDIFRRWYVDGRLYYHKVIDQKNPKKGIQELRYIEPKRIRKVKEVKKNLKQGTSVELVQKVNEYFLYNHNGLKTGATEGIKISPDSIAYCPSGLIDQNRGHVLSYLHKAIKPVNQLRMIEDSLVIYRISRAPERRIFYIDVGNLPKIKAEQYLKDVMNRYRNKLVYDASTGEIRDDRNHKFTKFVQRLRKKFTPLFTDILKTQLILKGVITIEDWKSMHQHIQYNFLQDGHFAELKKAELLEDRVNALGNIESYIGTFFSKRWVQKNVLNLTDAEIDMMQDEINKESGLDPDEGGIEVPDGTDGITRYPSAGGDPIDPDDVAKYKGEVPPEQPKNGEQ